MERTGNLGTPQGQTRVSSTQAGVSCLHIIVYRTGGEWSICNMYRGESLFELDPSYQVGYVLLHVVDMIIIIILMYFRCASLILV